LITRIENEDGGSVRVSEWAVVGGLESDSVETKPLLALEVNHDVGLEPVDLVPLVPCFFSLIEDVARELATSATAIDTVLSGHGRCLLGELVLGKLGNREIMGVTLLGILGLLGERGVDNHGGRGKS